MLVSKKPTPLKLGKPNAKLCDPNAKPGGPNAKPGEPNACQGNIGEYWVGFAVFIPFFSRWYPTRTLFPVEYGLNGSFPAKNKRPKGAISHSEMQLVIK